MLRVTGGFHHETRYFFGCTTSVPRLLQRIMEGVSWEAHLPQGWCGVAPPLSGPVTLRFLFVGVPQRKSVRRQATRYSSVAECNWAGNARHTSPNVWPGDDQLLSEAERVRPKQRSSFKQHYFSCLTMFFKYSYGILKLQHLLYLLKKLKTFFHENWLRTTSFKTVSFHLQTLYINSINAFSLLFMIITGPWRWYRWLVPIRQCTAQHYGRAETSYLRTLPRTNQTCVCHIKMCLTEVLWYMNTNFTIITFLWHSLATLPTVCQS